jgi:glycolate oxidase FAD binding subunit
MQAFVEQVLRAKASGTPLLIRGSGSKDFLGETSQATEVISTLEHTGIINYEPTELVITAKAGTPLALVEQTLAASKQMLGFEPPHFGSGATVGGAVATGLSGPRRATAGACRDFVLGANVVDAQGQVLRFGGEVMKNVTTFRACCAAHLAHWPS